MAPFDDGYSAFGLAYSNSFFHQSGPDPVGVVGVPVVVVAIGVHIPHIVGVVGVLQLEVLEYRLINEYSAQLLMNQLAYTVARWVYAEDKKAVNRVFCACFISYIVCTGDGRCGD